MLPIAAEQYTKLSTSSVSLHADNGGPAHEISVVKTLSVPLHIGLCSCLYMSFAILLRDKTYDLCACESPKILLAKHTTNRLMLCIMIGRTHLILSILKVPIQIP